MSDQFQDLLNAMLASNLREINAALSTTIQSNGLDPMRNVTSGEQTLGSIGIGPFRADAVASYQLQNLTGLSSLHINSLAIISANSTPEGSGLYGTVTLQANVNSNLHMNVGGGFRASVFGISKSVGISGNVTMSSATINAIGGFGATIGDQLCLTRIYVSNPGLNYGNVNIDINGLGIFNSLLGPLKNFILSQVKGPIIGLIQGAVTPAVNTALNGIVPQCTSLG